MVKSTSVSQKALSVARQVDQLAAEVSLEGGEIQVNVRVDPYTGDWNVKLSRVDVVRLYDEKGGYKADV